VVVFYLRQSNFVVFPWISVFIVGHFWHASSRLVTTSIYVVTQFVEVSSTAFLKLLPSPTVEVLFLSLAVF